MTRRRALAGALTLAAFAAAALPSRCALGVTRYELGYASLPAAFDGFRLVQLSDLHGARFGKGNARLLAAVRAERPELIALTGDILQTGSDSEVFAAASLCAALARIAPTYFVSGNHDVSCGALPRLASALAAAGVTYLRGGYEEITRPGGSIVVCGVEDARAGARVTPADELVRRAREKCPDGFLLFLGHRNDWLRKYPFLDVDLALGGHAHGGIVRLPLIGGLLGNDARFFPDYDGGLYRGSYDLIVSRGLGNSVPIPRLFNIPEIVSVTLRKI